MGKGEIARYEPFLFFPQCFQKACFRGASKGVIVWEWANFVPNNKILDWSKFKAFAEDKINVMKNLNFVLGRVENIVGKGENPGDQHFLLFPQMFSKDFIFKDVKSQDCVVNSKKKSIVRTQKFLKHYAIMFSWSIDHFVIL